MMGAKQQRNFTLSIILGFGATLLLVMLVLGLPGTANASPGPAPLAAPDGLARAQGGANGACLGCHAQPGQTVALPSGETLNLTIDADHYSASVHGSKDITCVTCHTDISGFPHPKLAANDLRDVAIQMSATCEKCHTEKFQLSTDSVHHTAMVAGNKNAAVCSDCHEPHTQPQVLDPQTKEIVPEVRVSIPQTCARCHNAIYSEYEQSIHGSALKGEGNTDVPTCTDCHGAHKITDPRTAQFRLKSPDICAKCHTDEQKMAKYGLSTQVLSTYVADFHGTTVTLFQKQSPDQPTNKPVCYDCHGVHNIAKISDPQKGLEVKANLLQACQKCHPDATTSFPTSWLSHYIPSQIRSPLVYYVQLFYKILIPTVIGGMVLYVISDGIRRLIDRSKGVSH